MRTWIMQRAMHWDRSDPALLDIIKAEVQAAQLAALPASALGKRSATRCRCGIN